MSTVGQSKGVVVTDEIVEQIRRIAATLIDGCGTVFLDCRDGEVKRIRRQDGIEVKHHGKQD